MHEYFDLLQNYSKFIWIELLNLRVMIKDASVDLTKSVDSYFGFGTYVRTYTRTLARI